MLFFFFLSLSATVYQNNLGVKGLRTTALESEDTDNVARNTRL